MFIVKGSIDYLNPGAIVILIITILIIMYLFVYSIWGKLFPIEHVASLFVPKETTGTEQGNGTHTPSITAIRSVQTPINEDNNEDSQPSKIIKKLDNNATVLSQTISQLKKIKKQKNNLIKITTP